MKPMISTITVLGILSIVLVGCMTGLGTRTTGSLKFTTYSAKYNISLWKVERPEKATQRYGSQKVDTLSGASKYRFSFEDDLVKILWLADSRNIAFSLENKTDHSIKIPWDEAAYVDKNGRSHRVMHLGIKYNDAEKPQAPSVVVRKGSLEDMVFPTDLVYYEKGSYYSGLPPIPGSWEKKPLLTDTDFHYQKNSTKVTTGTYPSFAEFESAVKSNVGKTYQVLLPLQIEDVINDYIFTFRVESVTAKQDTSSRTY